MILFSDGRIYVWVSIQRVSGGVGVKSVKFIELLCVSAENHICAVSLVCMSVEPECEVWEMCVRVQSMPGQILVAGGVVVAGLWKSVWAWMPILGVDDGVSECINFAQVCNLRDAQSFMRIVSRVGRVGIALSVTCGCPAGPRSARNSKIVRFW